MREATSFDVPEVVSRSLFLLHLLLSLSRPWFAALHRQGRTQGKQKSQSLLRSTNSDFHPLSIPVLLLEILFCLANLSVTRKSIR